jgi:hypothetical protein
MTLLDEQTDKTYSSAKKEMANKRHPRIKIKNGK